MGARPELMYLVVIVLAILEGPTEGAVVGLRGRHVPGLLHEPAEGAHRAHADPAGLHGRARAAVHRVAVPAAADDDGARSAPSPGVVFYETVAVLLSTLETDTVLFFRTAAFSALYTALLTPIVYPLLRRVFEGSRPRRVVRF